MTFALPWVLTGLLLLPVLGLAYRRQLARARRGQDALARAGLRPAGSPTRGPNSGRWRHLAPALLLTALGVLVIGSADPAATLSRPHREGTVILAFDVSNSMRADDLEPDRLAAAKAAAKRFVTQQPRDIRIGVVAFSDSGVVTQQPTDDPLLVTSAIDRMSANGGTALGQGIYASLQAISGGKLQANAKQLDDPDSIDIGYLGSAVIVLLSDGENRSELDPVAMARLASVAGVRIETVGVGSPDGGEVTIDGVSQQTTLDEQSLRQIADAADGTYHPALDTAGLARVYEGIDLKFVTRAERTPLAPHFATAGLLLAVLAMVISLLRTGRVIAA